MSKKFVNIIKVDNCYQCPNCRWHSGESHYRVICCDSMDDKIIGKVRWEKHFKPFVKIPKWCPLDDWKNDNSNSCDNCKRCKKNEK